MYLAHLSLNEYVSLFLYLTNFSFNVVMPVLDTRHIFYSISALSQKILTLICTFTSTNSKNFTQLRYFNPQSFHGSDSSSILTHATLILL